MRSVHTMGPPILLCSLALTTASPGFHRPAVLTGAVERPVPVTAARARPIGGIDRAHGRLARPRPVGGDRSLVPFGRAPVPAGTTRPDRASVPVPPWKRPLTGPPRVLRGFAPPPRPWLAGHRGVDLASSPGAEVRAAGAGTIGYAGPLAGRGVVTVLHRSGLRTTYLPVRPSVRRGQVVSAGEVIGVLQDVPGHCAAACLHWGLLRDHAYLDPLLLLGHGQVRLLPLRPARAPSPSGPPP